MKKLVPIKNSVVCKRVSNKSDIDNDNGILYKKNEVDIYEILDICSDDEDMKFKIGDRIMSCSTGDEIEINPNETVYLFKTENIMCKVED